MKTSNNLKSRKGGCIFSLVKLAILSVIVLAVAAYFSMSYIADYILKTATSGTGIDAGISSVSMAISEQKVEVKNFYITNPPNFKKCNAIEFKDAVLDADIDIADVLAKKLITLDEIKVVGLKMDIDLKTSGGLEALLTSPNSNLLEIKNALMQKFGLNSKNNAQQNNNATANNNNAPASNNDQWRIIIKKMVFDNGVITGAINSDSITATLPSFSLENIGVDKGGETPTELVADVVGQLSVIATKHLVQEAIKGGIKGGNDGVSGAKDAVKNVLKNIFKKN